MNAALSRFLFALLLAVAGAVFAAEEVAIPPLKAHVTDLTGTLSRAQLETLESRLRDFEQRKGSQIAVLMLPSVRPETIEQYSIRLAEAWKIGRAGIADGVILVIAKNDHTVQNSIRVEVGRGLEGAIPDAIGKRIGTEVIAPYFRKNDFYGGIAAGSEALMKVIEGEPLPAPSTGRKGTHVQLDLQMLFWLFVALVVTAPILKRLFGRVVAAAVGGGIVGLIVWSIAGALLYAVIGAVIGFFVSLINASAVTRGSPWSGGGWSGGGLSGGSWGGGGGGGGGFSGGGGDFGGGGASSNW